MLVTYGLDQLHKDMFFVCSKRCVYFLKPSCFKDVLHD